MKTRNKKITWCDQEDDKLRFIIEKNGAKDWPKVSNQLHRIYKFKKKTARQCRERWYNHVDPNIVKITWSNDEENILFEQHKKLGSKWSLIREKLAGRSVNSIKNHFYSTLRKSLRRINKFILGLKNSTTMINTIKPFILSKIAMLEHQQPEKVHKQLIKPSDDFKLLQDEKQAIYGLINFSRINISEDKNGTINQSTQAFEKLFSQVYKINQVYEQKKMILQSQNKEARLHKRFDEQIESESLKSQISKVQTNSSPGTFELKSIKNLSIKNYHLKDKTSKKQSNRNKESNKRDSETQNEKNYQNLSEKHLEFFDDQPCQIQDPIRLENIAVSPCAFKETSFWQFQSINKWQMQFCILEHSQIEKKREKQFDQVVEEANFDGNIAQEYDFL